MRPTPVTAVFDIGKTNKKYLLFDEAFNVVRQDLISPDEATDEDGFGCENLDELVPWMMSQLASTFSSGKFKLKRLNVSAYGASFMHLGSDGRPLTPVYNYLKPFPAQLDEQFFTTYGPKERWSVETASPPMGMLNSGLQLYRLKHVKPSTFGKISRSLHFPNWLMSLFSGNSVSEMTSIGCHTGLWNFEKSDYHRWVREEEMLSLFPAILPVTRSSDTHWKGHPIKTGTGIHDSSAALAPYLYGIVDPFILLSTGTWTIAMNPFNREPLTYDELQRDCLCYITVDGNPVKAARFFLGNEYEHQMKRLAAHFGSGGQDALIPEILETVIQNCSPKRKLKLETAWSTGPLPRQRPGNWDLSQFDSYVEAHHQLLLDLVAIQAESIRLAEGTAGVKQLVVTGGFSHNPAFLSLLAAMLPELRIYTDRLSHASALGAALVVQEDQDRSGESLQQRMKLTRHNPSPVPGIDSYRWRPEPRKAPTGGSQ